MAKKYLVKRRLNEGRGKSYEPGEEYEGDNGEALLKKGLLCKCGSEDAKEAEKAAKDAEDKAKADKARAEVQALGDSQAPKANDKEAEKAAKKAAKEAEKAAKKAEKDKK